MADTKVTDLGAIPALASGDKFHVADVSDITDDPAGTSKYGTPAQMSTYMESIAQTLTNKTIDADGTGNVITNIDTAELKDDGVTYGKIQNVTATDKILGRSTAGAGIVEEIACTSAGRALLDDANAAAQRVTLGSEIGVDVQAYDADTAKLDVVQTFTAAQTFSTGIVGFRKIGSAISGTTYTFVIGDAGTYIRSSNAAAQTITVPLNSSVAFITGTEIEVIQAGAGQVTFAATGGVTINSKDSNLALVGQYSAAVLKKIGTDEWDLIGDLG